MWLRILHATAGVLLVLWSSPLPSHAQGFVPTITHRDNLYDVAFVGDRAWIVGFPGIIVHSSDSGWSWQLQSFSTDRHEKMEALFAVDFVDDSSGWIVGRNGLILHTSDGGRTWTKQTSGSKLPLFDVEFVDKQRGWIVGHFATILHTNDGGKTWSKQKIAEIKVEEDLWDEETEDEVVDPVLRAVHFADARTGWAVGEAGAIFHTKDGGKTWSKQNSSVRVRLYDVHFFDTRHGYAVGQEGALVVTRDGGKSWKQQPIFSGTAPAARPAARPASSPATATRPTRTPATAPAAASETKPTSAPATSPVTSLSAEPTSKPTMPPEGGMKDNLYGVRPGPDSLWLVGGAGTVLEAKLGRGPATIPTALTFTSNFQDIWTWLCSLAFNDKGHGLIVGGRGTVLRTTDGGRSWTKLKTR